MLQNFTQNMNQIVRAVFRVRQVYSLEHRLAVSTMRQFSTGHPAANQAMPLPSTAKVFLIIFKSKEIILFIGLPWKDL